MSDLAGTADVIANVDGADSYVRIQVPTNAGALDPGKQLAVVDRVTTIAADAAVADRAFAGRTWVLPTEAPDGGWDLGGQANTNDMLVVAARPQVGSPRCPRSGAGNPLKDQ
jgi:phenylpyruvate tautomerase PptA (4-oxalocrotonate tautomerase family)